MIKERLNNFDYFLLVQTDSNQLDWLILNKTDLICKTKIQGYVCISLHTRMMFSELKPYILFQFVKWQLLVETCCYFVPILQAGGDTPVLDVWDPKLTGLEVSEQSRPKYASPLPHPKKCQYNKSLSHIVCSMLGQLSWDLLHVGLHRHMSPHKLKHIGIWFYKCSVLRWGPTLPPNTTATHISSPN